jgi:hypothetical protein
VVTVVQTEAQTLHQALQHPLALVQVAVVVLVKVMVVLVHQAATAAVVKYRFNSKQNKVVL